MNKLLRFDDNQLYCIFDTETCSTNLALDNYPWNLGILIANNKEILEQYNFYPYWEGLNEKISDGARQVTKFNNDIYKKEAKPQEEILEFFEKKFLYNDKYLKLGHTIYNFDIFIIDQWRRRNNKKSDWSFLSNSLDSDAIARAWRLGVKSIKRDEWIESMFRYGNYIKRGIKTNLTALGHEFDITEEKYGINYNELHSAGMDTKLNYYVWKQLMWKVDI